MLCTGNHFILQLQCSSAGCNNRAFDFLLTCDGLVGLRIPVLVNLQSIGDLAKLSLDDLPLSFSTNSTYLSDTITPAILRSLLIMFTNNREVAGKTLSKYFLIKKIV